MSELTSKFDQLIDGLFSRWGEEAVVLAWEHYVRKAHHLIGPELLADLVQFAESYESLHDEAVAVAIGEPEAFDGSLQAARRRYLRSLYRKHVPDAAFLDDRVSIAISDGWLFIERNGEPVCAWEMAR